jgi:hypothetical protein
LALFYHRVQARFGAGALFAFLEAHFDFEPRASRGSTRPSPRMLGQADRERVTGPVHFRFFMAKPRASVAKNYWKSPTAGACFD